MLKSGSCPDSFFHMLGLAGSRESQKDRMLAIVNVCSRFINKQTQTHTHTITYHVGEHTTWGHAGAHGPLCTRHHAISCTAKNIYKSTQSDPGPIHSNTESPSLRERPGLSAHPPRGCALAGTLYGEAPPALSFRIGFYSTRILTHKNRESTV